MSLGVYVRLLNSLTMMLAMYVQLCVSPPFFGIHKKDKRLYTWNFKLESLLDYKKNKCLYIWNSNSNLY